MYHLRSHVQLIEKHLKMFQRTFFFSCALVVVDLVGDSATTHCNILPPMAVIRLGMLVARIILLRQAHKTKAGH